MTKKTSKNETRFICEKCNYVCCYKSDYSRHVTTRKHLRMTTNDIKPNENEGTHTCECGKTYKYRQGLYSHKQKCTHITIVQPNNTNVIDHVENPDKIKDNESMILALLTQNKELMNLLQEQSTTMQKQSTTMRKQSDTIQEMVPKMGNNNTTNNNTNKFNLQLFLNEDCKDAINFSEFIEGIQVSVEDLENQAQLGYIGGISKLFLENMKELGVNKRPIHCTDKKRNTLYIKENDEWDKEDSQDQLLHGIKIVTGRAHQTLCDLKEENPEEYSDMDSDFSNKCINIQRNLLPGFPRESTFGKVIDSISGGSVVDKDH